MNPTSRPRRRGQVATLLFAALAGAVFAVPASAATDAQDFSPAERALFMTPQFDGLKPPETLHYSFLKSGSLEAGFSDQASLHLTALPNGHCCSAQGDFLSGEHRIELPPVDGVEGNPITLYFLERDIHEMQRLTQGQANYFRKRIRMAIYQAARVREVSVPFGDKTVQAEEITIKPYLDDPNRARFETLANKQYTFTLSKAVPGGVYSIHTNIPGTAKGPQAPALLDEELLVDGAVASPPASPLAALSSTH